MTATTRRFESRPDADWMQMENAPPYPPSTYKPKRRIPAYRPKSVPSLNLLLQFFGVLAILCGVFLIWGFAATLIAGGTIGVVLGTLREMQEPQEVT